MSVRLQFLGAAGTVTGSKYLLQTGDTRLLVDCGLFQGFKQLRLRNWAEPPFDPASLSAIVVTHAHLDHTGYLPVMIKRGFRGRIYCTEATADLCRILLPDSARLAEEDAERANRHRYSKHKPALSLYTERDAHAALRHLVTVPFATEFEPAAGLKAQFAPAGHILGAATVRVFDGEQLIVFSGDLGRMKDDIMRPPQKLDRADILVVESTYGDRLHPRVDAHLQLGEVVARVVKRGGVVVIPAFAVGRTQSLLWSIHRLKAEGRIDKDLPVYLNSPMATDVTDIYHRHHELHRLSRAECEAMCHAARIVNTTDESKQLNLKKGPMIIIAGSGMATGGRVVHHLKAFAPDPRNAIVLAGFQAGGTRGAALAAGAETIRIHGEDVPVRAEVESLSNLSAHADYLEILDWLRGFKTPPRLTFITHGEPAASDALRQRIERELKWSTRVPEYLEVADLTPPA
ncbi:MAG: MBL fold metallo-hydrolase [Alphaproteobacteria bacterium]|nr:MBL fold metallo-hydrolase [Alphaproteobacteria bacterium]